MIATIWHVAVLHFGCVARNFHSFVVQIHVLIPVRPWNQLQYAQHSPNTKRPARYSGIGQWLYFCILAITFSSNSLDMYHHGLVMLAHTKDDSVVSKSHVSNVWWSPNQGAMAGVVDTVRVDGALTRYLLLRCTEPQKKQWQNKWYGIFESFFPALSWIRFCFSLFSRGKKMQ